MRARLLPTPLPPAHERRHVVFLSRQDLAPRRSLRNQPSLLAALRRALAPRGGSSEGRSAHALHVYQGGRVVQSFDDLDRHAVAGRVPAAPRSPPPRSSRAGDTFSMRLTEAAQLFSRAALLTGPHGGAFLNLVYCAPATPVVEIGYTQAQPMAYPSYYHTMARRLGLPFWVVLGSGSYDRPITAPVGEVAGLVAALVGQPRGA